MRLSGEGGRGRFVQRPTAAMHIFMSSGVRLMFVEAGKLIPGGRRQKYTACGRVDVDQATAKAVRPLCDGDEIRFCSRKARKYPWAQTIGPACREGVSASAGFGAARTGLAIKSGESAAPLALSLSKLRRLSAPHTFMIAQIASRRFPSHTRVKCLLQPNQLSNMMIGARPCLPVTMGTAPDLR
jgi:hypothetical protein